MLFSIDDQGQGHFLSVIVIYTQKFILQNRRIKVVFV